MGFLALIAVLLRLKVTAVAKSSHLHTIVLTNGVTIEFFFSSCHPHKNYSLYFSFLGKLLMFFFFKYEQNILLAQ